MKNVQLFKQLSFKQLAYTTLVLSLFCNNSVTAQSIPVDTILLSRLPQFLIRFNDTTSRATINQILGSYNAHVVDSFQCGIRLMLAQVDGALPPPFRNLIEISEDAKRKAGVSNADANYAGLLPNPTRDTAYHFPSPFSPFCLDTSNVRGQCRASAAGQDSTVIAIIDSGLDGVMQGNTLVPNSPLFKGKLWNDGTGACGFNFLNDTKMPLDTNSHGTHVAGIIQQTIDYYGVKARLMILKTMDKDGYGTVWDVCRALDYAMCHGAHIVNMSLSYSTVDTTGNPSFLEDMITLAGNRYKMLVVAAGGNQMRNVDEPNTNRNRQRVAYLPVSMKSNNLLTVSATKCLNFRSDYTNIGKISIDLAVQGDSIFSPVLNNRWAPKSGTSMSTAFATGAAAVLASQRGGRPFNAYTIKESILKTVTPQTYLTNFTVTGGNLNICGAAVYHSTHVGIQNIDNQMITLKVYPNPFETDVTIEYELDKIQPIEITIYNSLGQKVLQHKMEGQTGLNQWIWQPDFLQPIGFYYVELRTFTGRRIQKITNR
jgi:Subtilase family/Secretion system C-terminal sorting domain